MKKSDFHLVVALAYSIISHGIAFLQFTLRFRSFELPERWYGNAAFLLALSLACSAVLFFRRRQLERAFLLFVRFALLLLIGYPLGDYVGVELTLLAALVLEITAYYATLPGLLLSAVVIGVVLSNQVAVDVWERHAPEVSLENLLFMGAYPLVITALGLLLKHHRKVAEDRRLLIEQLKTASTRLVDTNIQLQEYVILRQEQTILLERKRISREIHDIIGHTLMSIIMMMKAALNLAGRDGAQVREFLEHTREQAEKGLAETRRAVRILRSATVPGVTLVEAVSRLVKAFQGTHLSIRVEFGNIPWSFGERTDAVIYRVVQEGITNAIRHGDAKRIDILFWQVDGEVSLTIRDDGAGVGELVEGVGLNGIRERLEALHGHLEAGNIPEGFELRTTIPCEGEAG